ncbi:hypothetical protein [Paenochrobactrum pullorum]|uniref:hypothetical protein n=1 Tax=Paenochrobactrum pullorum TaxID=1324351 RepID=UPI0035BC3BE2
MSEPQFLSARCDECHGKSQTQYLLIIWRILPRQMIARFRVLVLEREGGFAFAQLSNERNAKCRQSISLKALKLSMAKRMLKLACGSKRLISASSLLDASSELLRGSKQGESAGKPWDGILIESATARAIEGFKRCRPVFNSSKVFSNFTGYFDAALKVDVICFFSDFGQFISIFANCPMNKLPLLVRHCGNGDAQCLLQKLVDSERIAEGLPPLRRAYV